MARIILVEDSKFDQQKIRDIFSGIKHNIIDVFSKGENLITYLNETDNYPDILIIDIIIKGRMSGFELAETIKENYNIPVIFLTAGNTDINQNNLKSGDIYLTKPIDKEELRTNINLLMNKKKFDNKLLDRLYDNINNLERILESIPDMVFLINSAGDILDLWAGNKNKLLFSREEALKKNISDILKPLQFKEFKDNLDLVLKDDGVISFQYSIEMENKISYYDARMLALDSENKEIIISVRDITSAKKNSIKIEELSQEYETILSNINNAIFLINVDNGELRYQRLNKFHENSTGLKTEEIKGKTPVEAFGEEMGKDLIRNYNRCLKARKTITYEEVLQLPNGTKVWLTKLSPVIINNQVEKIVGTSIDITARKKQEEEIKYISYHDKMTDLYNRTYFENEIERLNNSRRLPITILVADLDNLKYINDNYGHQSGDEYIITAAHLIKSSIRDEDIVARIGGDEFAIILPKTDESGARAVTRRIKKLEQKYRKSNNSIQDFSISVGYGIVSNTEEDLQEAFKNADRMMYQNKAKNKDKA